jgi:hypothetical protein
MRNVMYPIGVSVDAARPCVGAIPLNFAYDWTFARPIRKVFYNITVTAPAVAPLIGRCRLHRRAPGRHAWQAHLVGTATQHARRLTGEFEVTGAEWATAVDLRERSPDRPARRSAQREGRPVRGTRW